MNNSSHEKDPETAAQLSPDQAAEVPDTAAERAAALPLPLTVKRA